ncbi:MAG: serine hydrolase, partial [Bacillota bacterium]
MHLIDLPSGERVGIRDDLVFPAASTYKIPVAMYIL